MREDGMREEDMERNPSRLEMVESNRVEANYDIRYQTNAEVTPQSRLGHATVAHNSALVCLIHSFVRHNIKKRFGISDK